MTEDLKSVVKDSITAGDGSFYIGEIKPGKYKIDLDTGYLSASYQPIDLPRELNIVSGTEPGEIKDFDISLMIKK